MAKRQTPPSESEPTDGNCSPDIKGRIEDTKAQLKEETDRALEEFDRNVVDLLSWFLETETKARIFVYLREHPYSTSEEIADGTGLYPSTVREALSDLTTNTVVNRRKRENSGAGNNPYEYEALPPSDLVGRYVDDVQDELNALVNLDRHLGCEDSPHEEPVTITVDSDTDEGDT